MTGNVRQTAPELTWGTLRVTCDNSHTADGTGPQKALEGTEDMKSIDRLREYVCSAPMPSMTNVARSIVVGMTDEIEREVKALVDERDLLKTQWEAGVDFDQRLEAAASEREDVTLFGVDYTPLPVDADGVPIHVGDVMEWPDCSTAEVVGIGDGTFFYVEDGEDAAEWSSASDKIHHHAPTVEDVLREFLDNFHDASCIEAEADVVAEYAAKLRLVGEDA
ncbi:MAG: hypothetical protein IKG18_07010 [Atopobiaceae bacterium]|nr:hypothetical protein [Atopobiaceae bacterium]